LVYFIGRSIQKETARVTSVSGLPLTKKETAACRERVKAAAELRLARLKACPSGQDYSRQPTEADRILAARRIGESLDDIAKAS
jgi:hypothetical protein